MLNLNFTPFPILETERYILRQLQYSDINEIYTLRSDDENIKYLGRPKALSLDDAHQFIDRITNSLRENTAIFWVICLKNDAQLRGTICLWNIEKNIAQAEIGYELLPQYQSQGILQEVIPCVMDYGFNKMYLKKITAEMHRDNIKSIKLLEKYGFVKDDNAKFEEYFPDGYYMIFEF